MRQNVEEIMFRIRSRRKQLGITQAELARRCGIKQSNYSRFETGAQLPTLDTLLNICDQLRMEISLAPVDYCVYHVMNKDELVCIVEMTPDRKQIHFNKIRQDGVGQPFSGDRLNLERFYSFLKSRCYEDGRGDLDRILKKAHLDSNDPYEFIKLSHGVTLSDNFWIKTSTENLSWKDVKVR